MGSAVMTIRVLLSLCGLSVTVWARPYSGEDDDAFANLIQEIEAEGQAEGLSESDLGDLEDFESIELVEDPGLMAEGGEYGDMGIAGESIESIDEIKKITPIKRIQKVKKIQEMKDMRGKYTCPCPSGNPRTPITPSPITKSTPPK